MKQPVYAHFLAEEGSSFLRVGEYTLSSFPDPLKSLAEFLRGHPDVEDIAYRFSGRPHIQHIIKRKDEGGVSNAL